MAVEIDILQLPNSTHTTPVLATNVYPAVDVTNLTQSPTGTTSQYQIAQLFNYIVGTLGLLPYKPPCVACSTVNLNATYANGALGIGATLTNAGAQTAFSLDGIAGGLNQRYLIRNQVSPAQNGIYTLTTLGDASSNWVLTRAIDCNQVANIVDSGTVLVSGGLTQANTYWQLSFPGICVVGTTALTWSPFFLSSAIGGFTWNVVSGTTQQAITNNGYIITNVGLTTITMPASSSAGDQISIVGAPGNGGWKLVNNALQTVYIGSSATSTGILGNLQSTNARDCVDLLTTTTNLNFVVRNVIGIITVV